MIAVQPTSCRTFNTANRRQPLPPKLSFTVSMALSRFMPPIRPAKNSMVQPIKCPSKMAASPFSNPRGARYVPVRISAMETPAPNQIRPLFKVLVPLFSIAVSSAAVSSAAVSAAVSSIACATGHTGVIAILSRDGKCMVHGAASLSQIQHISECTG